MRGPLATTARENDTFQRALSALQAGDAKQAERLFKAVLDGQPKHVAARNLLGIVLMRLGRFGEAETHLRVASEQSAASDATLYNYGIVLKALNRPVEALERFSQALKINASVAETWNNRGTIFNNLKRFDEAIGDFERAIQLSPRYTEAFCNQGWALARLQRFDEALAVYQGALAVKPDLAEAWLGRGNIFYELRRYNEAVAACERARMLKPSLSEAWIRGGDALYELERFGEALSAFDRALALKPDVAEVSLRRGNVLFNLNRHDDALAAYGKALALEPDLAAAWLGRGNVFAKLARCDDAMAAYDKASALDPGLAGAWLGRGNVLRELKRYNDASAAYDKALALDAELAEAWLGRGNVLGDNNDYEDALAAYAKALALKPDFAGAWLGRGNVDIKLKQYADATAALDKALALAPDLAEAWLGRGNVACALKRYDEALIAYDRALALKPDLAEAWLGRGSVFYGMWYHDKALDAYDKVLLLKPDLADAWVARGDILSEFKRYDEAFAAYDRAVALQPDLDCAFGARLFAKLYLCDWTNLQAETAQLSAMIRERMPASTPFSLFAISPSAADQLQCARRQAQDRPAFPPLWRGEVYSHDRIRVAYMSADFHEHPVAYLTGGLFEHHDRSRFEITALSFGPDQASPTRDRIKGAFERFIDVEQRSDDDIADIVRRLEIDIMIDLMGLTSHNRLGVLARRPAPIQVNYLGYSGTTGESCIDYILADPTVIPEDQCALYSERVVWLPDCYLVNDDRRAISERMPTRRECGLPEDGFVFCCFNNTYKLAPETFEIWMRLLRAVPDSVLWLSEANATAQANLRGEAERCGVSAQRLIFAARMPGVADHLARQRQADLFLDTLPYNAHTTACDALWAGVPVLTCLGTTFAGRVAASLLKAVGLDELITPSLQDYEALALKLAQDPSSQTAIRDRLARNRNSFPLFNTGRSTRHIEAAYATMWQRYQSGETPKAASTDGENCSLISMPLLADSNFI
jgi:protein O-GlcNAc transferase